ncbi:MAG: hypothetical protein RBT05_03650 [Bacteroidales bacterium]|jgi:hypothetical protein|nr:hypothetical protein [Bacteroidales bacterium]
MKRLVLFITLLVFSGSVFSQKIIKNEVDKFTKKKIVETSFERICTNKKMSGTFTEARIAFVLIDDASFMRIKWMCGQILSIQEGARIMFLDSNGETYEFRNKISAVASKGAGATGLSGSETFGFDLFATGDISTIVDKPLTDMRIYTTDGYVDFNLNSNAVDKISKLYKLFEEASK